jgi:hypothetical protein
MENSDELFEILEYLQEENNKKLNVFNMLETSKILFEIHKVKDDLETIKSMLDYILENQRIDLKYLDNKLENILNNQKNEG